EGTAYLWAGRSGGHDELYWRQMSPGDLALCYRDRRIVSYSYIVATLKSARLGRFAWPDETNRPFDLIYFLTAPQVLDKPVADLPDYLGEVYQGLRRLAASEKIVQDFGSPEAFVKNGLQ